MKIGKVYPFAEDFTRGGNHAILLNQKEWTRSDMETEVFEMKKACVFLADGFEEVEGLTVVDLLRRANVEVTMVSIKKEKEITGAHGIAVLADACFEDMAYEAQDLLVLPGGMPGTTNLGAHAGLTEALVKAYEAGKYVAAICAAPSVLGRLGILEGKNATSYPGFETELTIIQRSLFNYTDPSITFIFYIHPKYTTPTEAKKEKYYNFVTSSNPSMNKNRGKPFFPINLLRDIAIESIHTTHYVFLDCDVFVSCKQFIIQRLFTLLI